MNAHILLDISLKKLQTINNADVKEAYQKKVKSLEPKEFKQMEKALRSAYDALRTVRKREAYIKTRSAMITVSAMITMGFLKKKEIPLSQEPVSTKKNEFR